MNSIAKNLFLSLWTLLSLSAMAQQRTVSGIVVDEKGQPLVGVNAVVVGTHRGTATDFDGRFSIRAEPDQTLKFSYVGYDDVLRKVGTDAVINVQMQAVTERLQEVVATGYTRDTLSDYVGAASLVNPRSIEKIPNVSIAQSLQGAVPGLSVLSGSGQPGNIPEVRVRGVHSISGSGRPLLVVDGFSAPYALFNTLDEADIKSISVLKDAVDLAPYGMRGTNGVIAINTKSGRKGKSLTTLHAEYGWSQRGPQKFDMMNSSEILAFQKLVGLGEGYTYRDDPQKLQELRSIHTDWRKVFFRTGTLQKHVFTTSFGNDNTQGRFSLGWMKQDGISLSSSYQKVPFSIKLRHRVNKFISSGIDFHIAYSRADFPHKENTLSVRNPYLAVYIAYPYQRLYRADGSIDWGPGHTGANAYDFLMNSKNYLEEVVGNGIAYAKVDLSPALFFKLMGDINYLGVDSHDWIRPDSYSGGLQTYEQGEIYHGRDRYTDLRSRAELTFNKKIGSDHRVKLSAFTEYAYYNHNYQGFTGYGLSAKLPDSYAAITPGSREKGFIPSVGGGESETKLFSYFVLGDYTYKGKYKISASFRRDNSSKLPRDNKWATLGSAGALWKIKDEDFLSAVQWIDDLSLKGSYGTTANADVIPTYSYYDTYTTGSYKGVQTLQIEQIANPNMKWEFSHKTNIGLNFGFFNRISGALNLYHEKITDLFINWQLSRTSGFTWIKDNQGEMVNKGIEFQLDADIIRNRNLTWSVYGNIAYNKNEVTDLGQVHEFEQGTSIIREGLPQGSHYLVGWAGVDPKDGAPMYYDKAGKKTKHYDPNDAVAEWGTSIPPTTGGFGTHIDLANGLYLHAQFTFALDYYRYNNQTYFLENPSFASAFNQDRKMLQMWQKPGDQTDIQGAQYPLKLSSKFVEDASFVRFRTLTLGWKMPDAFSRSLGLSGLELYSSVQNLFTWTRWTGFDPEDNNNIAHFEYPTPRIFGIGCNVSF